MLPSKDTQILEWTFHPRLCSGMQAAWFIRDLFLMILVTFIVMFVPLPHPLAVIVLTCFVLFVVLLLTLVLLNGLPSRKLGIDHRTITLTDKNCFGIKERRMSIIGAKVRAVYFDFLERLFTFDMYRGTTAHHIEISRNGETFLFPCVNEKEQKQIIEQIKQRIDSGGEIA